MQLKELQKLEQGYLIKIVLNQQTGEYRIYPFNKNRLLLNKGKQTIFTPNKNFYNLGGIYIDFKDIYKPSLKELEEYLTKERNKYNIILERVCKQRLEQEEIL